MFDFSTLPITPDQARAARNYCGMTQSQAAAASGMPAYKIKRFELGNTIPDTEFLDGLRSFYEGQGFVFPDAEKPGDKAKSKGTVFPAGVVDGGDDGAAQNSRKVTKSTVQHIRISSSLSDEEVGNILDHIEANEEEVEQLLQEKIESRVLLGGMSDQTEATHGKMVRLLAENGTLWAKLVGRTLVDAPDANAAKGAQPKLQSDLLAKTQAHVHAAVAGDKAPSTAKRKAPKANNLFESIFG